MNSIVENCYLLNDLSTLEEIDYNLEYDKDKLEKEVLGSLEDESK